MVYELAQWLFQKSKDLWSFWKYKGFFARIFFFPFVAFLWFWCFTFSMFLFLVSFMTILENMAKTFFFFSKRKLQRAGFFGKLFYLPLFLGSVWLCLMVIAISVGGAFPFKDR